MAFAFDRPTGPAADVAELEYVAALVQTAPDLRTDGSLVAEDVALLLTSRHGARVAPEEATDKLLTSFSTRPPPPVGVTEGPKDEDLRDEDVPWLDLAELVALLAIPHLMQRESADEGCDRKGGAARDPGAALDESLGRALHGVLDGAGVAGEDLALTPQALRRILESLGETEMASDDALVEEMIRAVTGGQKGEAEEAAPGSATLNVDTWRRALVGDLRAGFVPSRFGQTSEDEPATAASGNTAKVGDMIRFVPFLDFTADRFASPYLAVSQWVFFLLSFFTYYSGIGTFVTSPECEANQKFEPLGTWLENGGAIACAIKWSVVRWLYVTAVMGVYGAVYFWLTGLGHSAKGNVTLLGLVGAVAAIAFTFVPPFVAKFDRGNEKFDMTLKVVTSVFGVYVCCMNLKLLVAAVLRGCLPAFYEAHRDLFVPHTERSTDKIKRAGIRKVGKMLDNARDAREAHPVGAEKAADWSDGARDAREGHPGMPVKGEESKRFGSFLKHLSAAGGAEEEGTDKERATSKKDPGVPQDDVDGEAVQVGAETAPDSGRKTQAGPAMIEDSSTSTEKVGGLGWTWSRFKNGALFEDDGIWYSGRLLSINASQLLSAFAVLAFGITVTNRAKTNWVAPLDPAIVDTAAGILFDLKPTDKDSEEFVLQTIDLTLGFLQNQGAVAGCSEDGLEDFAARCSLNSIEECRETSGNWLCAATFASMTFDDDTNVALEPALFELSGYDVGEFQAMATELIALASQQTIETLYPTEAYMVTVPLIIFTVVAFIQSLGITFVVLPSITSTMLKLRTGVISFTKDPQIRSLRHKAGQMHFLRGAVIWSTVLSSLIMGALVGAIVFLALYQNTAWYLQFAVAALVGIIVVVLINAVITLLQTKSSGRRAFYRHNPFSDNMFLLARECAYIALSPLFSIIRAANLIVVATLYIGRLDTLFVAPGVGQIKDFQLDGYPYIFLTDILQHEAHRHPYIEIFSSVCLLKLEKGDAFVNRAGVGWRLVFVLSLMPWLGKYRRFGNAVKKEDEENLSIEDLRAQLKILKQQALY